MLHNFETKCQNCLSLVRQKILTHTQEKCGNRKNLSIKDNQEVFVLPGLHIRDDALNQHQQCKLS